MQKEKKEFLEAWGEAKSVSCEIKALLAVFKHYCDNDDESINIFAFEVLTDILINKTEELIKQVNKIEECSNSFLVK